MAINWTTTQTTKRGVNMQPLHDSLTRLENLFSAAASRRDEIKRTFGDTPHAEAALADLKYQLGQAVTQARADVAAAFKVARQEADSAVSDAYRDFATSREGDSYRQTLATYAPLADRLSPDDIAARLDRAAKAGLVGEGRAWHELGSMAAKPTPALSAALRSTDTRSDSERVAGDAAAKLDAASQRFTMFDKLAVDARTEAVFADRPQAYGNCFSPDVVIEGGPMSGQSAVTVG